MKQIKVLFTVLIVILIGAALGAGYLLHSRPLTETPNVHENLYSDNGYIDYAKEVYLDTEKYPDLAESGLFWTQWDPQQQAMVLLDADSQVGAALVDPQKPTVIFVHGMRSDGHVKKEPFYLNSNIAIPEQFDLDTEGVSLGLIWQQAGWNVGYYHYDRFTAEDLPNYIESKIWATDSKYNMRYTHSDGSMEENPTSYSLAEHFVAEYIRAIDLLPQSMGSEEIRLCGHSMGGELSVASLFLLTELACDGQIDAGKLPDRLALLDPYFSTWILDEDGSDFFILGPTDVTISWSGKTLPYDNKVGLTMIDCLKVINAKGIAVEYYTFDASTLVIAMPAPLIEMLKEQCVYVTMQPQYEQMNPEYKKLFDGHNGVRDWYYCSMYCAPVTDATNGGDAASAATPTATIKALRGVEFVMNGGSGTVLADDDTFIRVTK